MAHGHNKPQEDITAWTIGLILAITANIISNLGLNFQKKAHSLVFNVYIF